MNHYHKYLTDEPHTDEAGYRCIEGIVVDVTEQFGRRRPERLLELETTFNTPDMEHYWASLAGPVEVRWA